MNAKRVNEGTSSILAVSFFDENDQPFTPTTVTYRIDDLKSRTQIVPPSSVTNAPVVNIEISQTQNRLLSRAHRSEPRSVVVTATYAAGLRGATGEYRYEIVALEYPPVGF